MLNATRPFQSRFLTTLTTRPAIVLTTLLVTLALLIGSSTLAAQPANQGQDQGMTAVATFAGGCFWCMEPPFDKLEGVISTTSGYTGGSTMNPSYEEVSAGGTGHFESVQVVYDPTKVSYEKLLDMFWHNIDPLDGGGQFCDRGSQYRSAIFVHNEDQRLQAEQSKADLQDSGQLHGRIQTEILPATEFYAAEDYHQNYYENHPIRYKVYRFGCGRDGRLDEVWGSS